MPARDPFPGVYVEEVPSGMHAIHGAPTSIAAFVGRTRRGPVDRPVPVTSFEEFERSFGGFDVDSAVSYSVRDFFINGGAQACVVRRWVAPSGAGHADSVESQFAGHARYAFEGVKGLADCALFAASPGAWGNDLEVRIDRDGVSQSAAAAVGVAASEFFHLTITSYAQELVGKKEVRTPVLTERFRNVSLHVDAKAHRLDQMLATSALLTLGAMPKGGLAPAAAATASLVEKGLDSAPLTTCADYVGVRGSDVEGSGVEGRETESQGTGHQGTGCQGTGIYSLTLADCFQILCLPPDQRDQDVVSGVYERAAEYCASRRAFLVCDPPSSWDALWQKRTMAKATAADLGSFSDAAARHAAVYYPRVNQIDPLRRCADAFAGSGAIAGIIARTDASEGVWKSPAGIGASISGINSLRVVLDDADSETLAKQGINVLRSFPASGPVIWGARTLAAGAHSADESRYVAVRRMISFIEASILRGTQWTVFESSTEEMWAKLRLSVGDFLMQLWRQGAFTGSKQEEAFAVACGPDTTTKADVEAGLVRVQISIAPVRPAEFVVLTLTLQTAESVS